jgi:hypothetical protein
MSHAKNLQLQFLEKIKPMISSNTSLVDELAELLEVSNDSAYRRLRGDTILDIEELTKICAHFKVPFEIAIQPKTNGLVTFSYNKLKDESDGFKTWFLNLYLNIQQIADAPFNSITYAADDVPVWHHFNDDKLIAFKLFYWQKSILNAAEFRELKFNPDFIDDELIDIAKKINQAYNTTESVEIWTEDTLNSTLKQIEYFWENDFFEDKQTALSICDAVEKEIQLLKTHAAAESKNPHIEGLKNFSLYQSEVMLGNNSIIVYINNNKVAFVSNNTFNVMSTNNKTFVEENEMWVNNIMKKSILISGVNEKQRNKFFRLLVQKITDLRNKIV